MLSVLVIYGWYLLLHKWRENGECVDGRQFDYNAMLDKSSPPQLQISRFSKPFIIILSLISGLLLSLVIIFLKLLKKN